MATILEGEVTISRIKVIPFDGKKKDVDTEIIEYVSSSCLSFLKDKYTLLV